MGVRVGKAVGLGKGVGVPGGGGGVKETTSPIPILSTTNRLRSQKSRWVFVRLRANPYLPVQHLVTLYYITEGEGDKFLMMVFGASNARSPE